MAESIFLTRTIQLLINAADPDEKAVYRDRLAHWQYLNFKAANLILTHLFVQVGIKQLFYIEEGIYVKLAQAAKDPDGILTTSKENTTCQLLSRAFKGEIPLTILTGLNHRLTMDFNRNREAIVKGENRMLHPRLEGPMWINAGDMKRVAPVPNSRNYAFNLYGIPFRTYLGKDFSDKKQLLDDWVASTLKLRNCCLLLKKGKIFLKAGFQRQVTEDPLAAAIAEVSLGLETPMIVTIGKFSCRIGNKEEYLHRRLAIRAARQRVEASIGGASGGRGRKRKLKAYRNYANIEKNFVNHQLHVYSRRLIDLCRQKGVGTILLVNQQQKESEAKQDPFLLQNWSYYNLVQKIEYKATRQGISVIKE